MEYDLNFLKDHIVDLNRSKWEPNKSNRKKGIYTISEKVYVKRSDYDDSKSRPHFVFKFIDKENSLTKYHTNFGATPVSVSDPYWPETMVPDAEENYTYLDAILVKIPDIRRYVESRQSERERNNKADEALMNSYKVAVAADGGRPYSEGD